MQDTLLLKLPTDVVDAIDAARLSYKTRLPARKEQLSDLDRGFLCELILTAVMENHIENGDESLLHEIVIKWYSESD